MIFKKKNRTQERKVSFALFAVLLMVASAFVCVQPFASDRSEADNADIVTAGTGTPLMPFTSFNSEDGNSLLDGSIFTTDDGTITGSIYLGKIPDYAYSGSGSQNYYLSYDYYSQHMDELYEFLETFSSVQGGSLSNGLIVQGSTKSFSSATLHLVNEEDSTDTKEITIYGEQSGIKPVMSGYAADSNGKNVYWTWLLNENFSYNAYGSLYIYSNSDMTLTDIGSSSWLLGSYADYIKNHTESVRISAAQACSLDGVPISGFPALTSVEVSANSSLLQLNSQSALVSNCPALKYIYVRSTGIDGSYLVSGCNDTFSQFFSSTVDGTSVGIDPSFSFASANLSVNGSTVYVDGNDKTSELSEAGITAAGKMLIVSNADSSSSLSDWGSYYLNRFPEIAFNDAVADLSDVQFPNLTKLVVCESNVTFGDSTFAKSGDLEEIWTDSICDMTFYAGTGIIKDSVTADFGKYPNGVYKMNSLRWLGLGNTCNITFAGWTGDLSEYSNSQLQDGHGMLMLGYDVFTDRDIAYFDRDFFTKYPFTESSSSSPITDSSAPWNRVRATVYSWGIDMTMAAFEGKAQEYSNALQQNRTLTNNAKYVCTDLKTAILIDVPLFGSAGGSSLIDPFLTEAEATSGTSVEVVSAATYEFAVIQPTSTSNIDTTVSTPSAAVSTIFPVDTGNYYYSVPFSASGTSTSYTHTLKYNANGGTGTMSDTVAANTSTTSNVTIASNSFTRSGYTFLGWATDKNAASATYQPGSTVSVGANATVTLYAVWEKNTTTSNMTSGSLDPDGRIYMVEGKTVSITVSGTANHGTWAGTLSRTGGTLSKTSVSSGDTVTFTAPSKVSGMQTYTVTLTSNVTDHESSSYSLTIVVVPTLMFTNTPTADSSTS